VATDPAYQRDYNKKYYVRNREAILAKTRRNKQRVADFLRAAKSRPCADCKLSYPYYVMDFDHIGQKLWEPNRMINDCGLATAKAEIEKCEVVCSNCHRIRSHLRRSA
jgi:hypothetical protein